MKDKWGHMLQQGATTFGKTGEPTGSPCGVGSVSPVYFLMANIAGIRPTQPGFEEFTLHLQPADLTWLRTTVPTPKGPIALAYHAQEGALTVNFTVPEGALASVRIPLPQDIAAPQVDINGSRVWEQGRPLPGASKYRREGSSLAFAASAGTYQVAIARDV